MGFSFKLDKKKTPYHSKPKHVEEEPEPPSESSRVLPARREVDVAETAKDALQDFEVSFTLNLYEKGYLIGKPSELDNSQPSLQDAKSLHPYDRASESLFSAIESGQLPGDILDDIPSKFHNGTIVCEARDYRKFTSEQGTAASAANGIPIVHKVRLRMSLENVVKDIPLISDDSWTYSDLIEVESRIVKALQPQLCLDPTPMLDRLCRDPVVSKLNLGLGRKKRLRQTSEMVVPSNNIANAKKLCMDRAPENVNFKVGDAGFQTGNAVPQIHENMTLHTASGGSQTFGVNSFSHEAARATLPLSSQSKIQQMVNYSGPANFAGVNANISSSQNLFSHYADAVNSNAPLPMKRENQDAQLPMLDVKRPKQGSVGIDAIQQQQQTEPSLVGIGGLDMQWKNQLLHPQVDVKGIQYAPNLGGQRYPSPVINNMQNQDPGASLYFNQQGMRFAAREEQADPEKQTANNMPDQQQSRPQHVLQQQPARNNIPNISQLQNARFMAEKDKRKVAQSPRVSSGPMVQSPVSSKSGESGSVGHFGAIATASAMGSQKDGNKLTANPNAVAINAPSVASSPSESMQRQHQATAAAKRKSNSVNKTQAMSGVGSPASVSNMTASLNASSPSVGAAPVGGAGPVLDQVMLDRFAKIDAVTQRHHLNIKKNKVDNFPASKPLAYEKRELVACLSDSFLAGDFTDPARPISSSLLGGSINTCKRRIMKFMRAELVYQGVPIKPHYQLVMEKAIDGTVGMEYGDVEDSNHSHSKEYPFTLPTTLYADQLAAQFCLLMDRDGYQKTDDQIQPVTIRLMAPTSSPSALPECHPRTLQLRQNIQK
uniref:Uncharacterized protein n=1 Tax=Ananas comosus var. bracteatus TaxID=296719 RepID=A0A6V7Q4Y0_ANACO|nr:unnamed protein product [Ananas comosus var. bracteatus]